MTEKFTDSNTKRKANLGYDPMRKERISAMNEWFTDSNIDISVNLGLERKDSPIQIQREEILAMTDSLTQGTDSLMDEWISAMNEMIHWLREHRFD